MTIGHSYIRPGRCSICRDTVSCVTYDIRRFLCLARENDVMMGKSAVTARLQVCGIAVKRQDNVKDVSDELKWRGDEMRQTAPLWSQRRILHTIVIKRIPLPLIGDSSSTSASPSCELDSRQDWSASTGAMTS